MNEEFTRVTTIANLFSDFSSIPLDRLKEAQDRGNDVHMLCAASTKGLFVSDCPAVYQGYVTSFETWAEENIQQIVECEHRRFCNQHMITGKMDFVVRLKGETKLTLIDLKTGTTRKRAWDVQMGGYTYLLREIEPRLEIEKALIIRLSAEGKKPTMNVVENLCEAEKIFFHALECYKYLKLKPAKIEVEDV